jgi:hypothetical protein
LQSEVYGKQAAKMSRVEWGDREERASGFGSNGITIVIGDVQLKGIAAPIKDVEGLVVATQDAV